MTEQNIVFTGWVSLQTLKTLEDLANIAERTLITANDATTTISLPRPPILNGSGRLLYSEI